MPIKSPASTIDFELSLWEDDSPDEAGPAPMAADETNIQEDSTPPPDDEVSPPTIAVGDEVTYRPSDDPNDRRRARIVSGMGQVDQGTINHMTPLARALIGTGVADEVEVTLPTGIANYIVIDVIKSS